MEFGVSGMLSGGVRLFVMSLEAADRDAAWDRQGCNDLSGEPWDRRSFGMKTSNLIKQGISLLCRGQLAWNLSEVS